MVDIIQVMSIESKVQAHPEDDIEVVIPMALEEAKAHLRDPSRLQERLAGEWGIAPNYQIDIPGYRNGLLTELSKQTTYAYEMTVTEPNLFARGIARLRGRAPSSLLSLGIHRIDQTPDNPHSR